MAPDSFRLFFFFSLFLFDAMLVNAMWTQHMWGPCFPVLTRFAAGTGLVRSLGL